MILLLIDTAHLCRIAMALWKNLALLAVRI